MSGWPTGEAPSVVHQRARGALSVSFKRRGDASVLDGLRQEGCLKARFPRVEPDAWATAVTLNSSGGIAGGDRLSLSFGVGVGARACIAAQAAERFYRSVPGGAPSEVRTRLSVAAGAAMEWLPQETILFDRSALDRRLEVDVAPDGWFLGVESLVFGRAAMGEQVEQGWLRDLVRIRRGGVLLLHDAIRMEGALAATLARPAVAGGTRAVATLVYVAPDAEARLADVRTSRPAPSSSWPAPSPPSPAPPPPWPAPSPSRPAPSSSWPGLTRPSHQGEAPTGGQARPEHDDRVEAGASAWNGLLLARILAPDSASLRRAVIAALATLRGARPLPRVWMC
jgi:urease accessory protein